MRARQCKATWERFEDRNHNKQDAFENLCRSLFCRTKIAENQVLHSDPHHPGVEVAPVKSKDGAKWVSFQAKYFERASIGYDQIKKSMEKAVAYYAQKLDIIYLYCNKEITTTSKTYKEIERIAKGGGIEIIPVTKQSIIDEAMDYPTVLACYFGLDDFGKEWFEQKLKSSLDNLGKRYNPSFNLDTDAKKSLSLFLQNDEGVGILNAKKAEIIDRLRKLVPYCDENCKKLVKSFLDTFERIPNVTQDRITEALSWRSSFEKDNSELLERLIDFSHNLQDKINGVEIASRDYTELRKTQKIVNILKHVSNEIDIKEEERVLLSSNVVFISGEMGTGKSQLLSTSARDELSSGRMTLLLLGQTFVSDDSIERQIVKSLFEVDNGESLEYLLDVMEEKAYVNQTISLVFIDAINESRYRSLWKDGINQLIASVQKRKNIRLVISFRSGFEPVLFSDKVVEDLENGKIATIVHKGLIDNSPKAIFEFLSKKGVTISPEYYLQNKMNNPLFLTWYCEVYPKKELGMDSLISEVIIKADDEASRDAGFDEQLGMLEYLLEEIVETDTGGVVTKKELLELRTWSSYGVTKKIAYIKAIERAGILSSFIRDREEHFYFGYNLLEDYVQAQWVIKSQKNKEAIKQYCLKKLIGIGDDNRRFRFGNESVFAMVTALYAIKYDEECIDLFGFVKDCEYKERLINEFLGTFAWRNPRITMQQFIEFVGEHQVVSDIVWKTFIECSTKEDSVLNADGLTNLLMGYSLSKRDYIWTTYINELTEDNRIIDLALFFEAGNRMEGLSDKSSELLLVLYSWMLSSTNRVIRDRVSKAMVEILKNRFYLCPVILNRFTAVNDPYIIQRLYGVLFGAVTKRVSSFEEDFERLASKVYLEVFSKEKVYPDILLRDYARLIIERYIYEYPEKKTLFDVERITPPYSSDPIPKVQVVDYLDEQYHKDGMWRLLYSMKFDSKVNGVGIYGDFGRYVFQAALGSFKNIDEQNIYYYALEYIINELGYTNDLFGEYDTSRADWDRHQVKRIERIGKKYEWIAFYNILARLSDTHNVEGFDWNDKNGITYEGPWNPYVRDFDPTLNEHYHIEKESFPQFVEKDLANDSFVEIDANAKEINEWLISDDAAFSSIQERLIKRDVMGKEWVSLYSYYENQNAVIKEVDGFPLAYQYGEQHIWMISAMHIADSSQALTLSKLEKSGYIGKGSGMNTTSDCCTLYSREYAWSPGYKREFAVNDSDDDECSVKASAATIDAIWERQYDASQENTNSHYIPSGQIIQELGLYQKQYDGTFYLNDEIVAFDTSVLGGMRGELLIRRDVLNEFVKKKKATLFWSIVGEKQFFLGDNNQKWQRREGYFVYGSDHIQGRIKLVPC